MGSALTISVKKLAPSTLERKLRKVDWRDLGFGEEKTAHMLVAKYANGKWGDPEVVGRRKLQVDPYATVFNYGGAFFEGSKAFRWKDGSINLFRIDQNAKRFNESAARLKMPQLPEEYFIEGIKELVKTDKDFVPNVDISGKGSSLYIRPVMIGTTESLKVKEPSEALLYIVLSPSGPYFTGGFKPVPILVEEKYTRAAEGGTGAAKAAGNYAGSFLPAAKAREQECAQVLYLDAKKRSWMEEVGAMNVFTIDSDGVYQTPTLDRGTILPGITRASILELLEDEEIRTETGITMTREKDMKIKKVLKGIKKGEVGVVGGIGTAASVVQIASLRYKGKNHPIGDGKIHPSVQSLHDIMNGIQYGKREDYGWMQKVV
jgi:branched-chain amino acid aminotransferase